MGCCKLMADKKLKRILVTLDGSKFSEKGLSEAIYYAKLTNAEITGLNVVVVHPTLASSVLNYKKYLTEKSEKLLDSVKQKCEKEGIKFDSKILYGKPSTRISEFAQKEKFDLIIVGSRGLSGIRQTILGSIASGIVQKSKTSVLVVK